MLGGFNMNYLSHQDNAKTKDLYDTIFEKCAIPIINCLTRILETSSFTDNI